jgi:parvulin-like peptidyl-prolyl isomerase
VLLGGTPLAAVAKKHSHEPNASEGGFYDWVSPGSLVSKPIDQAVFSLEPGKLSQIIEDDTGYHILRVIERQPAGQVSFEEAQKGIKKKIENQKRDADQQKYLTELRTRTKVWTIYDPPG